MFAKKSIGALIVGTTSLMAAEAPWTQSFSLGLNVSKGNSESTQVASGYDGLKKFDRSELQLKANINYGDNTKGSTTTKSNDNYGFEADYRHEIKNHFYWLLNASYKVDNVASLNYRINIGPGLGYRFIDTPLTSLNTEAGLGYLGQKYDRTPQDDALAYRAAEKFKHKLTEKSSVYQLVEILGDVSEGDNWILKNEIGVTSSLAGNFSLKSSVSDTYTNDPALGKKQNDMTIMTMLVYSF